MSESLSVIADGTRMGQVTYAKGKLSFSYDSEWLKKPDAYHFSTSMPLSTESYPDQVVDAFLWGLLPDNALVIDSLAKSFKVSARNVFKLISCIGTDCAGAIQFIPPEQEATYLNDVYTEDVQWLSCIELEEHINELVKGFGTGRTTNSEGQFSLAGAQLKTALYKKENEDRWGVPSGATPTTHILKPAPKDYPGFAENEHYCLRLAKALGMTVADSHVEMIADTPVIVVKRYDRIFNEERYHRLHQEDFCQSLAIPPTLKYQNEGGPSVKDIAEVLWDYSQEALSDIKRFADALLFNYLIAGSDAHAKNFSLILTHGSYRLAPLYDIASTLPYANISQHKVKLAMKIGSEYKLKKIETRHWKACAKELRLPPTYLLNRLQQLAKAMPEAAASTYMELSAEGLDNRVIQKLEADLKLRSSMVLNTLFE